MKSAAEDKHFSSGPTWLWLNEKNEAKVQKITEVDIITQQHINIRWVIRWCGGGQYYLLWFLQFRCVISPLRGV